MRYFQLSLLFLIISCGPSPYAGDIIDRPVNFDEERKAIENVGGTPVTPLTKAQLMSNLFLIKYLAEKYSIEYVIGHHEYTLFEDHPLWLESNDAYRTIKVDPGMDFMNDLKKGLNTYNF